MKFLNSLIVIGCVYVLYAYLDDLALWEKGLIIWIGLAAGYKVIKGSLTSNRSSVMGIIEWVITGFGILEAATSWADSEDLFGSDDFDSDSD